VQREQVFQIVPVQGVAIIAPRGCDFSVFSATSAAATS
jgi:hypothetical protein